MTDAAFEDEWKTVTLYYGQSTPLNSASGCRPGDLTGPLCLPESLRFTGKPERCFYEQRNDLLLQAVGRVRAHAKNI